jgi:hypothetical protein
VSIHALFPLSISGASPANAFDASSIIIDNAKIDEIPKKVPFLINLSFLKLLINFSPPQIRMQNDTFQLIVFRPMEKTASKI